MRHFIQTRKKGIQQFSNYFIIGIGATIIDLGLLYILKEFAEMPLLLANIGSFSLAVVFNFILQKRYTFKNKKQNHTKQFLTFMGLALLGLTLNSAMLLFLSESLGIWYIWSKLFATGVVFIWNFFVNKWITFREK